MWVGGRAGSGRRRGVQAGGSRVDSGEEVWRGYTSRGEQTSHYMTYCTCTGTVTRIIRDIRFGTRGNFFNSRSPPKIFFSLIIRDSQVPSCSRLAPLPAPVHYVIGHRVRVREHCSRLSCTQSGLPTGRLDVFPDQDRPSHTSDHGRGDGTCPAGSGASIDD